MEDISIRTAAPEDAKELLDIYSYYVEKTAVTYEYDVPGVEEFKGRIENTLEKYPYIVAVENVSDEDGAGNVMKKDSHKGRIVGYAYVGCFKSRAADKHIC